MARITLPTASVLTTAAVTAALCAAIFGIVANQRLETSQRPSRIAKAKTRSRSPDCLYPQHTYPGGRDVVTPYGTIKVFEWGPEDGEKVLIMHGIGTPSLGYAGMANEFVAQGYRVMTYDYFGRGYSDSPTDVPHDTRLYLTQVFLVLASSPLPWTGDAAFHLVGYSLGGGLSVSIAAYYPSLIRSLTVICPGGLVRSTRHSLIDRTLYSTGLVPDWILRMVMRRRLDPGKGGRNKDVPVEFEEVKEGEGKMPSWEDMMSWQLENNEGFVAAYLSTFQHAPIYDQHGEDWKTLRGVLEQRRSKDAPAGLLGGRMCVLLGEQDIYVPKDEWMEDAAGVIGMDGLDVHILDGGHEIAIANGKEVAQRAITSWTENALRASQHTEAT